MNAILILVRTIEYILTFLTRTHILHLLITNIVFEEVILKLLHECTGFVIVFVLFINFAILSVFIIFVPLRLSDEEERS